MLLRWQGSEKPEIESGTATFQVFSNIPPVELHLENFHVYQEISELINSARRLGEQESTARHKYEIERFSETLR